MCIVWRKFWNLCLYEKLWRSQIAFLCVPLLDGQHAINLVEKLLVPSLQTLPCVTNYWNVILKSTEPGYFLPQVLFVLHPIMFLLIYVLHLMLNIIKVLPFYFLVSASLVIRDILAYFWQVLSRQQWCIAHNWTVSYFLRNHMRNNPIIISLFQSMKGGVFHCFNWVLVLNNFCFGLPSLSTLVH